MTDLSDYLRMLYATNTVRAVAPGGIALASAATWLTLKPVAQGLVALWLLL